MTEFTSDNYKTRENEPSLPLVPPNGDETGSGNHTTNDYGDSNINHTNQIALELTDELKQQEIVTNYVYDIDTDNLCLELNHKYNRKTIICLIKSDWSKFIETYMKELKRKHISPDRITMICDVADSNALKILEQRRNRQQTAQNGEASAEDRESTTQKILKLAKEQCQELFVDQYEEPYGAVKIRHHLEILPLSHTRFKNWICKLYYQSEGSVPNSESITNALNVLRANAEFDGKSKELHLRIAYGEAGMTRTTRTTIFYDLTNPEWEAVKITPEGWTIEKAPLIFRRHNAQPQVYPSKEYPTDIFDRFMKLLNIEGEERILLVKCYIIALFIPDFDKPILMLHGDPGAAKSTLQELVKTLVDPSSVLTFALPRDVNELVQQLDHNHVAFYDNVSKIPYWISDQFCRASTGAGSSKRRLFTDDDDKIYNFRRCVGFNGINVAATKSDLLDRGLIIQIERIDDKVKQKEHIWRDFEGIRSQLLGYIFDIAAKVLQMRQNTSIKFEKLPRMADFAEIGEIISRCMGNPDNRFIDAYYENIKLQTEQILDASLVASAIIKLMSELNEWKGTATELLEELDTAVGEKTVKNKYWPKTSSVLSRRINEIRTNLRDVDIIVVAGQSDPTTRAKTMVITKASDKPGELGKMPFEPLESFSDQNHTQVASDNLNGISNDVSNIDQMPLDKDHEKRAQNTSPNGMSGMNGIFRTSQDASHMTNACESTERKPSHLETKQSTVSHKLYWMPNIGSWGCSNCKLKGDRFDMQKRDCRGKGKVKK